ncbi:unnamed protein product [Sphagnum troendelagicum]|uniref:Uncharacterized protein n=1 Tax=Sphagnum troendelagicum TaxID=128251 RepID=A0ABP0T7G3_9BRYO
MAGTDMGEEDLYTRQKLLQRQLEFVDIQEEYIKDEQKNLKRELLRTQEEVKLGEAGCDVQRMSPPLSKLYFRPIGIP